MEKSGKMKSTVRCRKCDERVFQKDRALHVMKHYIETYPMFWPGQLEARRDNWYAYQRDEKKCFGSVRGWKGEPTKQWLSGIYESFTTSEKKN